MKNRLYSFVNKINKAVDSVTKALENSVSDNKQQDNNGSIIDKLPVGESKQAQKKMPVVQNAKKAAPVDTVAIKKSEPSTVVKTIEYSMYVCPECRKVYKVKGNDKIVKCSHCEGIHLKDMHIEESVWRAYGKDERDKIISNMLDEEEYEEAFEEVSEDPIFEPIHESSKFFDENGEFIDGPVSVKTDSNYGSNASNSFSNDSNSTFFFEEETKPSSDSFFSGYDNFNNMGSMPPKKINTYSPPTYTIESKQRRNSGSRPMSALVVLIMLGVVYFAGSSLFGKNSKNSESATLNSTTKAYSSETTTKPVESRPAKSNDSFRDNSQQDKYTSNTVTYKSEATTTKPSKTQADSADSKKNTNSSKSVEDKVVVPKTEDTQGNLVWVPTNGGKRYHSRSSCSGMKNPMQVTLEHAEANGYTRCQRCY